MLDCFNLLSHHSAIQPDADLQDTQNSFLYPKDTSIVDYYVLRCCTYLYACGWVVQVQQQSFEESFSVCLVQCGVIVIRKCP